MGSILADMRCDDRKTPTITMFRDILRRLPSRVRFPAALGLALLIGLGVTLPSSASATKKQANPPTAAKPAPANPASNTPSVGAATGLPVPRFVSLKSNRINVRRGPGSDNQISWVYTKKGLPVEIIAESDRWRKIRDRDGDTGWVWHSMLDGRRGALITGAPVKDQVGGKPTDATPVPLFTEPSEKSTIVAYAEVGVIARMSFCQDRWCELQVNGYEGWVLRDDIWGTYAGENFE